MNGSGHLKEDFSQPMYLFPVDHAKLELLFLFNPTDRYTGLREFFTKHGMKTEAEWMEKRLSKGCSIFLFNLWTFFKKWQIVKEMTSSLGLSYD